jgi:hypothetical protein
VGVGLQLAEDGAGEESGLDFEDAAIAEGVSEEGVGDFRGESTFVGREDGATSWGSEGDGAGAFEEGVAVDFAVVEEGEGDGVGDEGAELLSEVEGEGGTAETGLVEETEEGVEADGLEGDGEILGEEAVDEGQDGVDRIAGWSSVAAVDVELVPAGDEGEEGGEVVLGGLAFETEEGVEGLDAWVQERRLRVRPWGGGGGGGVVPRAACSRPMLQRAPRQGLRRW